MQEIYQVTANTATGYLNAAANQANSPSALAASATEFGTSTAQDMSDLFVAGAISSGLPSMRAAAGGYTVNRRNNTAVQTVTVTNVLSTPISGPIYLVVGTFGNGVSLGDANALYFTAGPNNEEDGIFGRLNVRQLNHGTERSSSMASNTASHNPAPTAQ